MGDAQTWLGSDEQSQPSVGWPRPLLPGRTSPASEAERHLGRGVSATSSLSSLLFKRAAFEQHANWASQDLSSRPEASFPSENQPCFKSVFVSAFGFQDFCELHQKSQHKSNKCYNFFGEKKLLCFLTCTTNSGSNLSLWLRTCHNNLFSFFRKEEQHLAFLQQRLIWKICKLTCNLIKMTWSTNSLKMQLNAHNPRPSVVQLSPSQLVFLQEEGRWGGKRGKSYV